MYKQGLVHFQRLLGHQYELYCFHYEHIQQDFNQIEAGADSCYFFIDQEEKKAIRVRILRVEDYGLLNHKEEVKVSKLIEHKNEIPDINLGTKISRVIEKESKGRLVHQVLNGLNT